MALTDRPMHTVPGLFDRLTRLYAEGEQAVQEGRWTDAIAKFDEGLSLDDQFRQRYVTMYAQRAYARHRAGDLDGALADYQQAIAMEPPVNQAQYEFHVGMCLDGLGRPEEAVEAYARSSELFPDHPGPYHLRGKILCTKLQRPADALEAFDRFRERADHPEVRQLRGWCLLQVGRGDEAIPDLQQARAILDDPWTDYLLAWAAAVTGDDDGCLAAIREAVTRQPDYRQYFLTLEDYAKIRAHPGFAAAIA